MKRNLYIGEFPPPMGGVTVKNALIKRYIYYNSNIDYFDLYSCKRNPINFMSLFFKLIAVDGNIIFGVGQNKRLKLLLQLIRYFKGKKKLSDCSIIMMGSTLQLYSKNNSKIRTYLQHVKGIYTESNIINQDFAAQGIFQTFYFPNCRALSPKSYGGKVLKKESMRLVFFSRVCKEKGAHYLFEIITSLNEAGIPVELDFYGVIAPEYKTEFENSIKNTPNTVYRGIFDSSKDDVYKKLHEYDLLLFPTTWKGEGVAGILIESKFAGIPSIVTNHNYNSEVVLDGKEGKTVSTNDIVNDFVRIIIDLYNDEQSYKKLAEGAWQSRKRYDIENYKNILLKAIEE